MDPLLAAADPVEEPPVCALDVVAGGRRRLTRPVLEPSHAAADVVVRGPAADLPLVLSRRRRLDAVPALDPQGDRALLDLWIEHMNWVTD